MAVAEFVEKLKFFEMPFVFKRIWKEYDQNIKQLVPFVALGFYSFLGAGMFYLVEKNMSEDPESENSTLAKGCVVHHGFWGAVYFVNTLYTTTVEFPKLSPISFKTKLIHTFFNYFPIIRHFPMLFSSKPRLRLIFIET